MTDAMHAIAAITARDRTADLARQALPDAPTIPDREGGRTSPEYAAGSPRHRASLMLRRLADRLDPHANGRASFPGHAS